MKHTVYKVKNLINGKIYIGVHSTEDPYDNYMGSGKIISNAIKTHGKNNFRKTILYIFDTEKEAYDKEREIITEDFVNSRMTYNVNIGGKGAPSGNNHPFYGKHHSDESKKKISDRFLGENHPFYGKSHPTKGTKRSEEVGKKISASLKGKRHSDKHKENLSKSHKGKKLSEEHKNSISLGIRGEKNPFYNKTHNEKTLEQIKFSHIEKYGVERVSQSQSKQVIYNNETKTVLQWSKILNLKYSIIAEKANKRIDGFSYV